MMSHGLDGSLLIGERSVDEEGRKTPRWLLPDQINCLFNKRVFCLACNSATLLESVREAGALAFLGFGDIETHRHIQGNDPQLELEYTAGYEECLSSISRFTLPYLLSQKCSFDELLSLVRLAMLKQASRFARYSDNFQAKEVAKKFLTIGSGCRAFDTI